MSEVPVSEENFQVRLKVPGADKSLAWPGRKQATATKF